MKMLKKFSTYFMGNIFVSAINFLMLPIYSKYIPPEDFGQYSMIMLFITISTIVIDFGLTSSFSSKYFTLKENEKKTYLFTIITFFLISGILIGGILISFPNLINILLKISISKIVLIKIIILIILTVFSNMLINLLILRQDASRYVILSIVKTIIYASINYILLVCFKGTYTSYFDSMIISLIFVNVYMYIYIFTSDLKDGKYFSKDILKKILIIGYPLIFHNILGILLEASGRYVLNLLLNSYSLGIFAMAQRFGGLFLAFIITPFAQIVTPLVFESYSKGLEVYVKTIAKITYYNILLGFLFIVTLYTGLDIVFHFFINQKYWISYNYIIFLLVGFLIFSIQQIITAPFLLKGKTYIVPFITLIGGISNVIFNFILIPKFFIYGSAIAFILSYIIVLIIVYMISQKLIYVKYENKKIINLICFSTVILFLMVALSSVNKIKIEFIIIKLILLLIYLVIILAKHKNEVLNMIKGEKNANN